MINIAEGGVGVILRDNLRLKLNYHDMHRPSKNGWHDDTHMHVIRD